MTGQLYPDGLDGSDVVTYGYGSDRWNFVEGEALAGIVAKLNKEQNRYVLSLAGCRVVWRTLLFYPGATLVRVTDLTWRPRALTFYFLGLRGQYRRLDGSRRFLHFLNEHVPLKLTAQTVVEYLRFYCFFMRHHGRPFLLAEKAEDLGAFPVPLTETQKAAATALLHPVVVESEDPATGYQLSAIVRFSDALFDCRFLVTPDGHVRMTEDRHLVLDLPVAPADTAARAWDA